MVDPNSLRIQIEKALEARKVEKKCPFCRNDDWDVSLVLIEKADVEWLPVADQLEMVTLTCTRCGGVRLFDSKRLGLPL